MARHLIAILAVFTLASCGGSAGSTLSKLNPFSWFGGNTVAEPVAGEPPQTVVDDGRVNAPQVVNARLDYTPKGAIVRAEGIMAGPGYHSAILRPVNFGLPDDNGLLWFEFRALPPGSGPQTGPTTISAGTFVANNRLNNVSTIGISGAQNDFTIRLR